MDFLNKLVATVVIAGAILTVGACRKPSSTPPKAILVKYQADALRLCGAIVDCIKQDVANRLQGQPERRKMIMNRMTRDLCVKKQTAFIGKLSTDPSGKGFAFKPENYKLYSECSKAVAGAPKCAERRRLHKEHASCRGLRGLFAAR